MKETSVLHIDNVDLARFLIAASLLTVPLGGLVAGVLHVIRSARRDSNDAPLSRAEKRALWQSNVAEQDYPRSK